MSDAPHSEFLYVTYIRTTPERLWSALTEPDFVRRYWFGMTVDCTWTKGAPWTLTHADGRVMDTGEVIDVDPPRSLVLRWRNVWKPEFAAEGHSRCTFQIEPVDGATKLTVHHVIDRAASGLIGAVSNGWPKVLSSLKTLIETETQLLT